MSTGLHPTTRASLPLSTRTAPEKAAAGQPGSAVRPRRRRSESPAAPPARCYAPPEMASRAALRSPASPIADPVDREVAVRLARSEQRYTALRRELVGILERAGRPLTMPEILGASPGLSQSTAYRNVSTLIEAGAVRRVSGADDHGRFELAEDLAGHHHHLVCASCGKVSDVVPTPKLERALRDAVAAAAGDSFEVSEHRFELVGTCSACR
jgi:Fe2+ or Zn2+ uptake regulation protein